jgi:hypothetical protein
LEGNKTGGVVSIKIANLAKDSKVYNMPGTSCTEIVEKVPD